MQLTSLLIFMYIKYTDICQVRTSLTVVSLDPFLPNFYTFAPVWNSPQKAAMFIGSKKKDVFFRDN